MVLAARARALGHDVSAVRVFYDGQRPERDEAVREELSRWLLERAPDLVVTERLFDPTPLRAVPEARVLVVSWGDAEPTAGVDFLLGANAGLSPPERSRRSPSAGELVRSFEALLEALRAAADPPTALPETRERDARLAEIPGLTFAREGAWHVGPPAAPHPLPSPFDALTEWDTLAHDPAPPRARVFLIGNAGCPYARDPSLEPHYAGLPLDAPGLARLGCAFCAAGGDYQKRDDGLIVESLLEQAQFFERAFPNVRERVLIDQRPERYLSALLERASERGVAKGRWLFSARADTFVRETHRVAAAVDVARRTGQVLELYLSGFESFSDAELRRYNKGVSRRELLDAVRAMRALAASSGGAFEYGRARGHSLVLYSPWTTPDDLAETVDAFRSEGLSELFDDVGRNRLRLTSGLPITLAAERDDALRSAWDEGDEGAGRQKGYASERPWRFLDERTRLVRALGEGLRELLGRETEVAQLAAAVAFARERPPHGAAIPALAQRLVGAVRSLGDALDALGRRELATGISNVAPASAVHFAGACNNGCEPCAQRERYLADDAGALATRVDDARARGVAVALAGREPTLHRAFLELVRRARGADGRHVAVVSNARRFAVAGFGAAAARAGLVGASVKLFAPDAATSDAITRDAGAHAQATLGLEALTRHGVALEARLPLHALTVERLTDYIRTLDALGVRGARLEVGLDALGLAAVERAVTHVAALADAAERAGVELRASPLAAGTRYFGEVPVPARARLVDGEPAAGARRKEA